MERFLMRCNFDLGGIFTETIELIHEYGYIVNYAVNVSLLDKQYNAEFLINHTSSYLLNCKIQISITALQLC